MSRARNIPPTEVLFWQKVRKGPGCWEWTGHRMPNGYGQFRYGRKAVTAHRVALLLSGVDIPAGMDVCHSCDNRGCVNPAHLFVGTRRDNMQDAKVKGRTRNRAHRGSSNGYAKLTEADIPIIRQLAAQGMKQRDIGKRFGVGQYAIWCVINGRTWLQVTAEQGNASPLAVGRSAA